MATPLKIAHVVSTYPPYRGGMGNVAHEYVERLRARGHHVHVFAPAVGHDVQDPDYVHRLKSAVRFGNASLVPSLFARLSGFDLVHIHYPFFGGAELVAIRKTVRGDQGLVLTYHMDAVSSGGKGFVFDVHRKVMFPWIMHRADRILVSSKEYADTSDLARYPDLEERIEVHPFGIDLERFHPGLATKKRLSLGIQEKELLILFVGGMDRAHSFKGVSVLLEALKKMPTALPWKCVLGGDGNLRPSFEASLEDHPHRSRIQFVGSVPDSELPAFYRAADIVVFPSTARSEAFGMVALEAAASGKPVIASQLPGVSFVVLDGVTGRLVTSNDAEFLATTIEDMLIHADRREAMGFAARQRAEESFAWDPLISALEETYLSVLARRKTSL
ncbi:glycosyltransferase family 4 protein [Candidatus Uhrbacteria bacterium]|nr:glycosyltransferase family 4 protein [Candidatus Uhrbacteria bacterium]